MIGLTIDVLKAVEVPSREEVIANIADGAFDPSLLVSSVWCDGARFVAVMARKVQELGIEADRVTDAVENHTLEVVVEDGASDTLPSGKCLLVTGQKVRKLVAGEESQEDGAR